jgi:hypothetical protein
MRPRIKARNHHLFDHTKRCDDWKGRGHCNGRRGRQRARGNLYRQLRQAVRPWIKARRNHLFHDTKGRNGQRLNLFTWRQLLLLGGRQIISGAIKLQRPQLRKQLLPRDFSRLQRVEKYADFCFLLLSTLRAHDGRSCAYRQWT